MKLKLLFFSCFFGAMDLFADVLHEAVKNKDIVMLTKLIDEGYDVNAKDLAFCTEKDIVLYCQQFDCSNDFMKQMVENIKLSYSTKPNKKTALHYAAELNFVQGIQLLLQAGADFYSKDIFDRMPLKIAVQYNALQAAELLLQYYNSLSRQFYILRGLLHDAAQVNSPQMINILLQAGAKNGAIYGRTALHIAVQYNAYDAAAFLLQSGANKYAKNRSGKTPKDFAQNDKMKNILRHFGKAKRK